MKASSKATKGKQRVASVKTPFTATPSTYKRGGKMKKCCGGGRMKKRGR